MNARSLGHYYLHIREDYTQRRVKDSAVVELRHILTHETAWAGPVALLVHSLTHFVTGAKLTAEFLEPVATPRKALASAPSRAALRALGVPLRPVQEARRTARRANSAHKKRAR